MICLMRLRKLCNHSFYLLKVVKVLAMSDDIAIKVENLTKTYRLYNSNLDRLKEALHPLRRKYHHEFNALYDVSFEIKKGESMGIIGKNGSGKSTLLKLITGVLTPTHGRVVVNGRISALLELGAGFNPELTGIENVYFNGTLMGHNREEMDERLDEILAFADIGEFVYQPVKSYSSGMFVRLAFAVAINTEPDILIVDEALAVGDIRFQRKCFSKIEEFKSKSVNIVFVGHDMPTITNLCSKAILLDQGEISTIGDPRLVAKEYMSIMFDADSNIPIINGQSNCDVEIKEITDDNDYIKKLAICELQLSPPVQSTQELRHGNKLAEIIDYGIYDDLGARTEILNSNKQYVFFLRCVYYADICQSYIGFVVRTVEGVELFWTNNEFLNLKIDNKVSGDIVELRANIINHLAPGNYFLSFVIRDSLTYEALDRRMDALPFSVVSSEKSSGGYIDLNPSLNCKLISNVLNKAKKKVNE